MKAIAYIILFSALNFNACKSDNKEMTEDEKKELESVSDQIRKDSLRADSAFKAMQKRIEDSKLDTSVKLQEPGNN